MSNTGTCRHWARTQTWSHYVPNGRWPTGTETFPFVVRGELEELDAHVLNGRCPYAGPGSKETDPVTRARTRASGTLVGFYTELEPGLITHHGSRTHVHVLLEGDPAFVGHDDAVRIRRGARIGLPLAP